jgi:APA family basic amino acid/polyamine antiporter
MRLLSTSAFFTPGLSRRARPSGRWPWISAVIGVIAVSLVFGDAGAPTDATIAALPHGIFSSFGYPRTTVGRLPNSLLAITLTSNFGTFILYALSCFLCMVAYHKRPDSQLLITLLIPGFGLLANLVCMGFYLAGPVFGLGTFKEPLLALGISASGASTEPSTSCVPPRPRARRSCWSQSKL